MKPDNPAQFKRFVQAVKDLGLEVDEKAFFKALDKIVPKKGKGGSN